MVPLAPCKLGVTYPARLAAIPFLNTLILLLTFANIERLFFGIARLLFGVRLKSPFGRERNKDALVTEACLVGCWRIGTRVGRPGLDPGPGIASRPRPDRPEQAAAGCCQALAGRAGEAAAA